MQSSMLSYRVWWRWGEVGRVKGLLWDVLEQEDAVSPGQHHTDIHELVVDCEPLSIGTFDLVEANGLPEPTNLEFGTPMATFLRSLHTICGELMQAAQVAYQTLSLSLSLFIFSWALRIFVSEYPETAPAAKVKRQMLHTHKGKTFLLVWRLCAASSPCWCLFTTCSDSMSFGRGMINCEAGKYWRV